MRDVVENRHQMLIRIKNYCNSNILKWQSNAPFTASFGLLEDLIDDIEEQIQIVEVDYEGITEDKQIARDALTALIRLITAAFKGYASVSGTRDEFKKVDFTATELEKASVDTLNAWAQEVIDKATEHLASLATYGVTQPTITSLINAKAAFYQLSESPEEARSTVKKANEKIVELVRQAIELLENRLDQNIIALEATEPDFVATYFNNRQIIDSPTTTMALRGHVEDSETHQPLAGVNINIPSAGISRTTPESGVFEVINLPAGNYDIHLDCPGFNPLVFPVVIVQGQTTDVTIPMVRV